MRDDVKEFVSTSHWVHFTVTDLLCYMSDFFVLLYWIRSCVATINFITFKCKSKCTKADLQLVHHQKGTSSQVHK